MLYCKNEEVKRMKERMMITGAEGFLGARIVLYYEKNYDVIQAGRRCLDITDKEAVTEFLKDKKPQTVIHCAAISNTGICQADPDISTAVNVKGSVNIAEACRERGCRLVFMSSDQIYGGSMPKRPNKEMDEAFPVNVYGMHKKQAEEEILRVLPDGICLRLPWMYDFPVRGLKSNSNLLVNLLKAMIRNQPIKLPVYDYRGITWVQEVVKNIEPAMKLPGGIYNFGSESALSTYEIGRQVLEMIDINKERGELVIADETRFLSNPRNLTMDMEKIRSMGIDFPETVSGFEKCLKDSPEYVNALIE